MGSEMCIRDRIRDTELLSTPFGPTRSVPLSLSSLRSIIEDEREVRLDELTVADDTYFFDLLKSQKNLPDYIKKGLAKSFS